MPEIPIINRSPHPLPIHQSAHSAGADLHAWLNEPHPLAPFSRHLISTGLYVALPEGFELQIRPRSGLAFRHGITVLNAPGTVDADYRGELRVLLINLSHEAFMLEDGMRIAQMVLARHQTCHWKLVNHIEASEREKGGFGHTGLY